MYISRNPAKTRPLSPNVKRLMRLSRTSPQNDQVAITTRTFSEKDYFSCTKQGEIFMEATSMGFSVDEFTPMFMTSQIAGVFDVFFSADYSLPEMLRIPTLLESPELIVEALYWIDDIITHNDQDVNQSLLIAEAYSADQLKLPDTLANLPEEPNRDVDELAYSYWLGYIYRYECLLHDESSRMVYSAFNEFVMREVYSQIMSGPLGEKDLTESAPEICEKLDSLLVEKLWK